MIVARPLLAALLAFGCSSPAAAYDKLPRGLAKLTPADVVQRIRIEDDQLEPHVVVSTKAAWDSERRIEGAHASDVHLRALIDRESGAPRWQVWHDLVYEGEPGEIAGVNYHVDGRLEQAELAVAEHRYDDCPSVDAMPIACTRYTRFVFEIPGDVIRQIAASYRPESREPWRLRFRDESGRSITGGLAPAEAAGLVQAVEQVRREGVSRD
ncbi:MAG TPA: hypothetical protein VJQ77_07490 [Novosphingobium sp.]|nr:hypothetical protein [Novosphingobium sp.]